MPKNNEITQTDSLGEVNITTNILESIASQAAYEVEGVSKKRIARHQVEQFFSDLVDTSRVSVKKNDNDNLTIDIKIDVIYGYSVPEVAIGVQDNIKEQILFMTDLVVDEVNVFIEQIYPEETKDNELQLGED